jgi:hypothetical protein
MKFGGLGLASRRPSGCLSALRQDSGDEERVPLYAACEEVIDDEDVDKMNVTDARAR